MKNFSMKVIYKISTLIVLLTTLSACQLSPYQESRRTQSANQTEYLSYSDYYLWLKSLSSAELFIEIKQQKKWLSATEDADKKQQAESKSLLIYSLPNPTVYQPYKAKALLNKYPLPKDVSNETDDNLAFMVMLRDQLNSQLHLLSKQKQIETAHLAQQTKKNAEILRLKKQLTQLRAIEKNISGHSLTNEQL